MDAAKHLKGLGWRGEGHSLDTTNRGLRKPLLVSNRHANQGLGSKSQKEKQADQWWLNAFDNALKDIGTGKSSSLEQVAKHGVKRGGLYGFFVRGEALHGTIQENEEDLLIEEDSGSSSSSESESDADSSTDPSSASTSSTSSSEARSSSSIRSEPVPQVAQMSRRGFGRGKNPLQSGSNAAPLGANRRIFGSSLDVVEVEIDAPAVQPIVNGKPEPQKSSERKKRKREEPVAEVVVERPVDREEPELKKPKVVDGVEIPIPTPIIRDKKKKESAREVRDRRKIEHAEETRQNAIENKQKAIAEGTFDFEAEERKKKERELNRMVKEELQRRENEGEFGPKLPHPSVLLKYEKEIEKELKQMGRLGDTELEKQMMHDKVNIPELDRSRKIKYKEEKYKRESLKRQAKRDIRARMRSIMFGEEYIPEGTLTKEEVKKKRKEEKAQLKAQRKISRAAKEETLEEIEAAKQLRRKEKEARRAEKKEIRRKTAEAIAALKIEKEDPSEAAAKQSKQSGSDMFAGGADEIKLGLNVDGRQRTIPGVGAVSRYPTAAEKKLKKIESRAFEAGISVEEYKAKLEKEKEELEAPEKQRVAEVQRARGGLNSKQWFRYCWLAQTESQADAEKYFLDTRKKNAEKTAAAKANGSDKENSNGVSNLASPTNFPKPDAMNGPGEFADPKSENNAPKSQTRPLSEKKRQKYAAKAEAKGITVDEYIAKKEAKEKKKEQKNTTTVQVNGNFAAPTTNGTDAPPVRTIKAPPGSLAHKLILAAKTTTSVTTNGTSNITETATSGFIVDTAGDPHLNNTRGPTADLGFIVDTAGDDEILTRPKPVIIWHPDMLGDRKVKDLSKEERRARTAWMRERRAARHVAEGKVALSKKERHKKRVEKKQKQRDYLVAQIMTERGKPKEEVSSEELNDARRKAKRAMREIKREKRNKVIHRKKLGGGLRGQFGGAISMGGRDRGSD